MSIQFILISNLTSFLDYNIKENFANFFALELSSESIKYKFKKQWSKIRNILLKNCVL